jgi:osmoprotectant transport system permease protein
MSSQGNPWFSWDYIRRSQETLLDALRQHIFLTVVSVALAAVIAIALAVLAHRVGRLAGPFIVATGTLYTIPSLALFAFLAPFTGLYPRTVIIGLVMYALLILLRAALTGLQQVPSDVREVAKGMGYGPAAMLWRVELPLALPSIMTGLRIATVSTVALVTVGDIVGVGGLGSLILSGFRNNFYRAQIMTATLATVLLALVLDALLVLITYWVTPWARGRRSTTV